MIQVSCADNRIIYNAYHLIKAFFQEEEVRSEVAAEQTCRIHVCQTKAGSVQTRRMQDDQIYTGGEMEIRETANEIEAGDIRTLYIALRERTGRELPWGMLTGVRPVKLAVRWRMEHRMEYETEEQAGEAFADWFYEDRFVSREKALLAYRTAAKEQEILLKAQASVDGYSLYVGIPFCPSICSYCSFSSGEISRYADQVDSYLDALGCELRRKTAWIQTGEWGQLVSKEPCPAGPQGSQEDCLEGRDTDTGGETQDAAFLWPTSIYIGGGTPTSLNAVQLTKLLQMVEEVFRVEEGLSLGAIREYTVEAGRPDSITREKLAVLKRFGVTRISINPQTMQQKTLDVIGRRHTVEEVREACALAREMGFDNINMDLIVGLPGETNEDVQDTLRQIQELNPDSLTVHSLAVKRSSAIGIAKRTGGSFMPVPDASQGDIADDGTGSGKEAEKSAPDIARMITDAYNAATSMGMEPYYLYRQKSIAGNFENIGYARAGKEGLYNILIMEEIQTIAACGAGASTKLVTREMVANPTRKGQMTHMIRQENVKNVPDYIQNWKERT